MPNHEDTVKESMVAMMNHILAEESASFADTLNHMPDALEPDNMVEADWHHCFDEYNVLRLSPDRQEGILENLFNTLALHSVGHVYCDAVRMKTAMVAASAAKKDYTTHIAVGVDEVLTLRDDWTEEQAEEWLSMNFKPARDRLVKLSWEVLGDLLPPEDMSFEDYKEDLAAAPEFSSAPRG